VLWIVENVPGDPVADFVAYGSHGLKRHSNELYELVKERWLKQMEACKANPLVAIRASMFCRSNNEEGLALEILKKALVLNPSNTELLLHLALFFELLENRKIPGSTANAIGCYHLLLRHEPSEFQQYKALDALGRLHFRLANLAEAKSAASSLVEFALQRAQRADIRNHSVHLGNTRLGNIAVRQGDTKTAISYLDKSTVISDSVLLSEAGPDLSLARKLLEEGEIEAVLRFISQCERFNFEPRHKRVLKYWREKIGAGEMPG
jgi:tetratricopeptide (TPR) repeat protein